jgi:hypothetical protein
MILLEKLLNSNVRVIHGIESRIVLGVHLAQTAKYNNQRENAHEYEHDEKKNLFLSSHTKASVYLPRSLKF